MSFIKPAAIEVFLEQVIGHWLLSPYYRRYAKSLNLAGDENALELGCGGGNLSRHLARMLRKKGVLTCLDTSAYWLGRARRRLKRFAGVQFCRRDIRTSPLPAGTMDVAVVHYVLHDIEETDRADIVRALANALRPGGFLCVREPMAKGHGMAPEAVRALMVGARLEETRGAVVRTALAGTFFEAMYVRSNR